MALSSGKSVEKNEIRTSQRGQFSTSIERPMSMNSQVRGIWHETYTFVENNFVSKDFDVDDTSRAFDYSRKYFSHRLGASFDVHGAYSEHNRVP